jgi:hypothetical protein
MKWIFSLAVLASMILSSLVTAAEPIRSASHPVLQPRLLARRAARYACRAAAQRCPYIIVSAQEGSEAVVHAAAAATG